MCVSEYQVRDIVHEELKPVKQNINAARNWAIGLLIGLLTVMFGIGVWVGTIDNRVTNNTINQQKFESRIDGKLERIEDLLIELSKNKQ